MVVNLHFIKNKMKNSTTIIAFFFTIVLMAQTNETSRTITNLNKQKMLCYQIAKNYLAVGSDVKKVESLIEIEDAIGTFEVNYDDLVSLVKDNDSKLILKNIGKSWSDFRLKSMQTPTQLNAIKIITNANHLDSLCSKLIEKTTTNNDLKTIVLPNIYDHQQMLSQKMAMYYMASYWKVPFPELNKEMTKSIESFDLNIDILYSATYTNDDIKTILKLQKDEWLFIKKSFSIDREKQLPVSVLASSTLMFLNFDHASSVFDKLPN